MLLMAKDLFPVPAPAKPEGGLFSNLTPAQTAEIEALIEDVADVVASATADGTRTSYDYWWRRWVEWCTHPEVRYRTVALPAISPTPPLDGDAFALFLFDFAMGPKPGDARYIRSEDLDGDEVQDGDERSVWARPAPSTLDGVYSAIKFKAKEVGYSFTPEPKFDAMMKGLRKKLLRKPNKARPLVVGELRTVCEYLYRQAHGSPNGSRDRVVAGLYHAGVGLTEMTRIPIRALHRANDAYTLTRENDAPLHINGVLGEDLDDWLLWRGRRQGSLLPALGQDGAFKTTPTSRPALIAVLNRLAKTAGHTWKTSVGPLTDEVLRDMRDTSHSEPWGTQVAAIRDRALLLIGWGAALRRSELANLLVEEVDRRDTGAVVYIRKSKTDQLGAGATLPIPKGSHAETDVVDAVGQWLGLLDKSDDSDRSLLFRAIDRHGNINGALDGQDIAEMIQRRVLDAGVVATEAEAAEYAGHSLRRGVITSLAEAGVEATVIQKLSRHKSLSVLSGYVDEARALDPARNPLSGLI